MPSKSEFCQPEIVGKDELKPGYFLLQCVKYQPVTSAEVGTSARWAATTEQSAGQVGSSVVE
jgi:hypothetical protein